MIERTLSIFKPDSIVRGCYGAMLQMLLDDGFSVRGLKLTRLSGERARSFYAVHKERPFFGELVEFMTSGPIVAVCLERDDAINRLREVMGPTDSTKAPVDTIRGRFGTDIQMNAIHGSDSPENARREISFFFTESDLLSPEGGAIPAKKVKPGGSPAPPMVTRPPRLRER